MFIKCKLCNHKYDGRKYQNWYEYDKKVKRCPKCGAIHNEKDDNLNGEVWYNTYNK